MTNNPDDTCKCGIRRSDCEYHRVSLRDLWAAAIGVRDTIVYAGKDEKILPPSLLKTSLADLLREQRRRDGRVDRQIPQRRQDLETEATMTPIGLAPIPKEQSMSASQAPATIATVLRVKPPARPRRTTYAAATAELETYFAGAESILGLHGSGYESGSALVWDSARCADLQERMLRVSFGDTFCRCGSPASDGMDAGKGMADCNHGKLRDLARITPTVRAMAADDFGVAMVTFTPRRWPKHVTTELSRGARLGSLVGLALEGKPLRREYTRRFKREPTPMALLDFLEREAARGAEAPGYGKKLFDPVTLDAETRLCAALAAYDALMCERRRAAVERARVEAMT